MSLNKPPTRTVMLLEREKLRNAQAAAKLDRVVFLAGPYISTSIPPSDSDCSAAILRYKIYHYLDEIGWSVTLGEYNELIDTTSSIFEDENNAHIAEISHVEQETTDAIIMLPSSPGSFVEFGSFLMESNICNKMIVLIDDKYEKDISYINSGAVPEAIRLNSVVEYVDYSNHVSCFESVKKFVDRRYRIKIRPGRRR